MILIVDIGNTNTVCGVFNDAEELVRSIRLQTARKATRDEIYATLSQCLVQNQISLESIRKIILGSVVPELDQEWKRVSERFPNATNILFTDHKAPWSFRIDLREPAAVGADRLANAEAATKLGGPCIVVDAGTATKFDVIEEDPEKKGGLRYVGGVIAAGVGISFEALINNTSRLRMVSLIDKQGREIPVVGSSTEWALRSGAVHGFITMVDGMVSKILTERKLPASTHVIATGGFSPLLRGHSERCNFFDPNHTLEGYYAIAKKL